MDRPRRRTEKRTRKYKKLDERGEKLIEKIRDNGLYTEN